ncbi:MAG TPA: Hsp20 family protein [Telluria sp.]|nr:Hsp20 family protein [Telluria sp.]
MANNLTPFDPFREMSRMMPMQRMEELLRELRPAFALRELQDVPAIRCDVVENDQAYTVKAEIPGVKKEDIKVDVLGNRVTISIDTQQQSEQKEGERVVRSELYRGQMYRSFTLEHEVDDSAAEARYADGILELTLPKKAGKTGHKLEIH